jgi:basic membrane lipoprotein Med (substrate-binding protein (PBP1-ABC) superfamily)
MQLRLLAIPLVLGLALGAGGCASNSNKDYEEVLMPLQTGSVLQRHVFVKADHHAKPKKKKDEKKKDEKKKAPKPDAEPDATPAAEDEATPPPADRFR